MKNQTNEPFNSKAIIQQHSGRTHDITIAEVRELESFKNMSDEQAAELIRVIKTFTLIAYRSSFKQQAGILPLNDKSVNNNKAA